MESTVAKWGNSLALRLPKQLAQASSLKEGTAVDLTVRDGALVVTPVGRRYDLDALLEGVSAETRHGETDWGAARGREAW